jgi:hypothetical protein
MATKAWTTGPRESLGPSVPNDGGQVGQTRKCPARLSLDAQAVPDPLGPRVGDVGGSLTGLQVEHVEGIGSGQLFLEDNDAGPCLTEGIRTVVRIGGHELLSTGAVEPGGECIDADERQVAQPCAEGLVLVECALRPAR